jgi:hypothetical protein
LIYSYSGHIRQREPESAALSHAGVNTYLTAHFFDNCPANGQPQSRALHEAVELDETPEDIFEPGLRDSAAGIRDIKIQKSVRLWIIPKFDTAGRCKLYRIVQQINDYLGEPAPVRLHTAFRHLAVIADEYTVVLSFPTERIFKAKEQFVYIDICINKFQSPRFYLGQVEHIADKLQQQAVIVLYD